MERLILIVAFPKTGRFLSIHRHWRKRFLG